MSRFFARPVEWLMTHRSSMPAWVNRLMESVARSPDGFAGRVAARLLGGDGAAVTEVPDAAVRVFIGPTNYSGQGYRWARALEAADTLLAARNMAVTLPGGFGFPADSSVPITTANTSSQWADDQWRAVSQFTHVLFEAERPLFGKRFDRDVVREADALKAAGVSTAFLAHGTDVRDPERHAARTPWSPYPEDARTSTLSADAQANLRLLAELSRPVFVSTPDLLEDVPGATWCPVVIDTTAFATDAPVLSHGAARVIHPSSSAVQKGSHLLEPALARLIADGSVVYEPVTALSAAEMPARLSAADIVLDQFRIGSYGVAACEAMAAGRVVVGHVLPDVRAAVRAATGLTLPIVEATPDTLSDVVAGLLADPDSAREIAAAGPVFVRAVHSGALSAKILLDEWIKTGV